MPKTQRNYGSGTSFLDLLFNSLLAFVGFFMLSLLLIKQDDQSSPSPTPKIEFMITVTWPPTFNDDVDSWLVDPLDNIIFFNHREEGLMHLDRDDLGVKNDNITLPNGKKYEYRENREVVSIRGIIPGEYIFNLHMFSKREPYATPVTVKLEKMNPFKTVVVKEVDLVGVGDEKTVFRFKIGNTGEVESLSDGPARSLIKKKVP
jgi:hypothetical protein